MKRIKSALIVVMILAASTASCFAVDICVDGSFVQFNDNMGYPFIDSHNRTQVPLRATMETCGCKVDWNAGSRTAIVQHGGTTVQVPIGESYILANGRTVWNDTVAIIRNNRTYLPIRDVLEAFGMTVSWNAVDKYVIVNTK